VVLAVPRTRLLPGFKLCPVCGCRYQGRLEDHLDRPIKGADGISRCDWRLYENRIYRVVQRLKERGWRRAGHQGAATAVRLSETHPNLALYTTSGSVATSVRRDNLDPAKDLKAWWLRCWVFPLSQVSEWRVRDRARYAAELDRKPWAQAALEGTYELGGVEAVRALRGQLFGP
jgi:hypothetical protein